MEKFLKAIADFNKKVRELCTYMEDDTGRQLPLETLRALQIATDEYTHTSFNPINLYRIDVSRAHNHSPVLPRLILILSNATQFNNLQTIPSAYRKKMVLILDEAHHLFSTMSHTTATEKPLWEVIEQFYQVIYVTATAANLHRFGAYHDSLKVVKMRRPANHIAWFDGWRKTQEYKAAYSTICSESEEPEESEESNDASNMQIQPLEDVTFRILGTSTTYGSSVAAASAKMPDPPPLRPKKLETRKMFGREIRQTVLKDYVDGFPNGIEDPLCLVRQHKNGAYVMKPGNGQSPGAKAIEMTVRNICDTRHAERLCVYEKLRKEFLQTSAKFMKNQFTKNQSQKLSLDTIYRFAKEAWETISTSSDTRMLVNACTEKNRDKIDLCNKIVQDGGFHDAFVMAHYNAKEHPEYVVRMILPQRAKAEFDKDLALHSGIDVRRSQDSGRDVLQCRTLADAYSLVNEYKRATGAPLVRSICIDGNLGIEGVSYRPNDHSGFLTHAIFAWTPCRDLGTIKQLVGRVNGIVNRDTWTGCTVFIPSVLKYHLTFAAIIEEELLAFHFAFPGEEMNIRDPTHCRVAPMYARFIDTTTEKHAPATERRGGKRNRVSSSREEERVKRHDRGGSAPSTAFIDPVEIVLGSSTRAGATAHDGKARRGSAPWAGQIQPSSILMTNSGYRTIMMHIYNGEPINRGPVKTLTLTLNNSDKEWLTVDTVRRWRNECEAHIQRNGGNPANASNEEWYQVLRNLEAEIPLPRPSFD